jgi:hypothetical protein
MYDYVESNTNSINENVRYINKESENPYQNKSPKLTEPNSDTKNAYKNILFNINNNYKHGNNQINIEQSKDTILNENRKKTIDTILNTSSKSYLPTINKYNSKVIVENIRQPKDLIYLLDNFIMENNYHKNYDIHQEKNKIIFTFYDEEEAFNFTKLLNNHKLKNSLYKDMQVNLALAINDNYTKNYETIKKRGISTDTIQRLFQGLGGRRREKKLIKKKLNVLINSPFYSPDKNGKKAKLFNYNENYKDYNKYENSYPIRVLDDDYQPLRPYNFRSVEKNKWVSPTNFHI